MGFRATTACRQPLGSACRRQRSFVSRRTTSNLHRGRTKAIANVIANERWAELKILLPYTRCWGGDGLAMLREEIEAENEEVVIPRSL